jgi:hypothetical protein
LWPPPARPGVPAPNGKPIDNRLTNLHYGTAKQNKADRDAHGRTQKGIGHYNVRLRPDEVMKIRAAHPAKNYAELAEEYEVH